MAKKRTTDPEPRIPTAAAPARQPRKRTAKASSAAPAAPSTPVPEPAAAPEPRPLPEYAPAADEIARLAYSYWVARGCRGGSPEEDWLRAERELRRGRSLEAGAA